MSSKIFGVLIIGMLILAFYFNIGGWGAITVENALEKCPSYNVRCLSVKTNTEEPLIKIVGKDIRNYCQNSDIGCYKTLENVIILRDDDAGVLAHEQCHRFCGDLHITN